MTIHRSHPAEQFVIIPNATVRDGRLSYAARGVLAELLSRPDNWSDTADALWRRAKSERGKHGEGRDVLRKAFAELEGAGYLSRIRLRDDIGRLATYMEFSDVSPGRTDDGTGSRRPDLGKPASSQVAPTPDSPTVGSPAVGSPAVGESGVYKKTDLEDLSKKTSNEHGSLSRAAVALAEAGADEREILEIVRNLEEDPAVRRVGAYLRTAVGNGDAPVLIAESRNRLDQAERMQAADASMRRTFGWPCAFCRSDDHDHCAGRDRCGCKTCFPEPEDNHDHDPAAQ